MDASPEYLEAEACFQRGNTISGAERVFNYSNLITLPQLQVGNSLKASRETENDRSLKRSFPDLTLLFQEKEEPTGSHKFQESETFHPCFESLV